MDLPFLKKSEKRDTPRQYLFAVEISPAVVKSAVWTIANEKTQVLAVAKTVNWDDRTAESLITAVDTTLTEVASKLDPSGKIAPEQTILGLSATWVNEDKIVPDKLALLKDMATQLDLKLVGFVVTPEAVVKYLQHSENMPPTAILLGFWPHHLELTLIKLGKVIGMQMVNRSTNAADDVVEGLSRFSQVDMLPSRMLLYDSGSDLEETRQLLLAHPWQAGGKKLPFLHFPKIEILASDYTIRAIALAGGTEVARAVGLLPTTTPARHDHEPEKAVVGVTAQELGFSKDAYIAPVTPVAAARVTDETEADVEVEDQPELEAAPVARPATLARPRFAFKLPKFQLPHLAMRFPKSIVWVIVPIVVVAIVAGLGIAYWFVPKAAVTVLVTPKSLDHQFALTADTKAAAVDASAKIIPAEQAETEVSGSSSVPTTGTKLVGDRAVGNVVILNTTDTPRKLASGTVITSPSGLKFVLDQEVTVASGSGSVFNPQPGKITAAVTAGSIGTDYNLTAGTEFRVGTFATTQIAARNETALSGGTSRQVKAVAKEDIAKLRANMTTSLKDQARQQLTSRVGDSQTIIAESVTLSTVSENFSSKLDEAADNLTLDLKVKAAGLVVSQADLDVLTTQEIQPQIPEGYSFSGSPAQTFRVTDTTATSAAFSVSVSAKLLPKLDNTKLAQEVTGKSFTAAREHLQTLPEVTQIDIEVTPRLPSAFMSMPHVSKNIAIVVTSAE